MKKLIMILIATFTLNCFAEDPQVVAKVDVSRYMGLWFQIAHYPNFFQRDCLRSTAEYAVLESGKVSVFNSCTLKTGEMSTIKGEAFIPDATETAKLKVDFGFAFLGDYWIIDLDPNYQWAIVSGPNKKSLFILARTAPMDGALLKQIIKGLDAKGYDVSRIIFDVY